MVDNNPIHLELPDGGDGYRLACGLPVLEVDALEMDVRPSTDVDSEVTCLECRRFTIGNHWLARHRGELESMIISSEALAGPTHDPA